MSSAPCLRVSFQLATSRGTYSYRTVLLYVWGGENAYGGMEFGPWPPIARQLVGLLYCRHIETAAIPESSLLVLHLLHICVHSIYFDSLGL